MAKSNVPEISLKSLAEFTNASLSRKKTILKTIKSSKPEDMAKKVKYNEAKSAIKNFMADENHSTVIFEIKRNRVKNKKTYSSVQATNKENTLLAIEKLEQSAQTHFIPYLKYKSEKGLPKVKASKIINGVLIHFTPDIILKDKITDHIEGAIKLIFNKKAITLSEGYIICGLLKKHIEKEYRIKIALKNCFALDVFANRGFTPPSSEQFNYYNMLLKKAYIEINKLWSKV